MFFINRIIETNIKIINVVMIKLCNNTDSRIPTD